MLRDESMFNAIYHGQTTLHPLALAILVILIISILKVERKFAVIPFLIMACFISSAQRIVVLGLDFNMIRILVLFGWLRVLVRGETSAFKMESADLAIILWALVCTTAYTALRGTSAAFVLMLGQYFEALGMYFLFRFLVRDWEDVKCIAVALVYLSVPVALFFIYEKRTANNLFSIFGGVPEVTMERHGKLRAQGAFAHPIIAGCFWISQIPIIAILWWNGREKLAQVGIICSVSIVVATASSTPAIGILSILIGMVTYRYWASIRFIFQVTILFLLGLHLVMEAPVWHLISRIDIAGGSTGYHRYQLVDQAINRFNEWWLMGTVTTAHWGWAMFDVANEYVANGKRGGILTLILFTVIITLGMKYVGRLLIEHKDDARKHLNSWALGVALFVHCSVFIGVSYFGQITVVWYLLLAIISSLYSNRLAEKTAALDMTNETEMS